MTPRTEEIFHLLRSGGGESPESSPAAPARSRENSLQIIRSAAGADPFIQSSAPFSLPNTRAASPAALSSVPSVPSRPGSDSSASSAGVKNSAAAAGIAGPAQQISRKAQLQRELSDSQQRLDRLRSDAAYLVTAEQGAEMGRQMDQERARIKALNEELNALNRPKTNAERDSLIQRMNDISAYEGYATTVELADEVTREKQDTRQRLHQLDEELGNAARFYDSGERSGAVVKGALKQTSAAYTNFMGTLQGVGNRLHEDSSLADQAVAGSDYEGWATDELTAANMAAAAMKENPDGNYLEGLQKEEQRLYEKADTMTASAAKDIEQAREGLSALGKAGVDISVSLIQNGIDAAAKAAGLGMAPFFIRAAGGALQEARQAGASTGQQVFYGLTKGGIEAATELLSGGIAGTGISGIDKVVEPLIDKLAKSTAGKIALNAIYDAAMEGGEEALSDLLDPFAKLVYNDQAVREAWENRAEFGAQMLYDFLIGAAVGSIGSGTKIATGIVTGQDAEKNAALAEADAQMQASPGTRLPVGQNNTVPEAAGNPGMASNESGNLIGKTKTAPAGIKTGVTAESGITGAGETVAEASAFNNTEAQSGGKYNSNDQSAEVSGSVGERAAKGSPPENGSPFGGAVERSETEGATAAKPTDPAEAAAELEYRRLVENAITEGDYQRTLELYREYNNPALRAYKEFYTLKTFSEYAAAQGYIPATDTAVGTEEALAAFEESYRNAVENAAHDGIIRSSDSDDIEDNTILTFSKKQFGKKVGKHAVDFGLDPSSETDRTKVYQIVQDIVSTATEQRIGFWRGQSNDVVFHIKGDDVVVTTLNGEFITILKGGINNERVKNAGKR